MADDRQSRELRVMDRDQLMARIQASDLEIKKLKEDNRRLAEAGKHLLDTVSKLKGSLADKEAQNERAERWREKRQARFNQKSNERERQRLELEKISDSKIAGK